MAYGDSSYSYTMTTSSTSTNGNSFGDWYYYDTGKWAKPTLTYTYPTYSTEETEVACCDVCHLCKAELIKKNTFEWRDRVEEEDCEDPYEWKSQVVKEYECGTVVRSGHLADDAKRVTLGKNCIELGA